MGMRTERNSLVEERELYYSWAIREALAEEMERDERVFLLGEDIGSYGGAFKVTEGLVERFGEHRVRNTPISENTIVGVATGAAVCGLRPVAEIMFMDFITLAMDQLVNHAAKYRYMYGPQVRVPLVVRTPAGGGRGYGATHSQSLEGWFMSVPGVKVVAPSSPADAKGLLKSAIRDDNPVLFVENKNLYGKRGFVPEGDFTVPIGEAHVARAGTDVTFVSYSRMVGECLRAADLLSQDGIEAEVVDLRSLEPLDMDTVAVSVEKTGRAVLVEEGVVFGGVCAEIGFRIIEECFDCLEAPLVRLGQPKAPLPCAASLERLMAPNAHTIAEAAAALVA
jgi:pyruvate dehydrogenase E1 component beta subunit